MCIGVFESKSLTRPSKKSSPNTLNQSRFQTIGRKLSTPQLLPSSQGPSQRIEAKGPSQRIETSDSRPCVEKNENFEYSEVESDRPESEYFGMDMDIQNDAGQMKSIPLRIFPNFGSQIDDKSYVFNSRDGIFSQQKSPDVIPLIGKFKNIH